MRIISGKLKGRRLTPPKNLPVRPTTDMGKEALFNILNHHFHFAELKVLDLFAGTGAISYEFASRGATPIVSVDAHIHCFNYIKKTAKEFELDITPVKSDVFQFLEKNKSTFDLIFADPPYDFSQEDFERVVTLVTQNKLLEEEGLLVVEHSKFTDLSHLPLFSNSRTYGGTVFSFFEYAPDGD